MNILLRSYSSKVQEIVEMEIKGSKKLKMLKKLNEETLLFLNKVQLNGGCNEY